MIKLRQEITKKVLLNILARVKIRIFLKKIQNGNCYCLKQKYTIVINSHILDRMTLTNTQPSRYVYTHLHNISFSLQLQRMRNRFFVSQGANTRALYNFACRDTHMTRNIRSENQVVKLEFFKIFSVWFFDIHPNVNSNQLPAKEHGSYNELNPSI